MPGKTPTTRPPAARAPALAEAITPPRPPVSSTAPARATSAPTSRAIVAVASSQLAAPTTAIWSLPDMSRMLS